MAPMCCVLCNLLRCWSWVIVGVLFGVQHSGNHDVGLGHFCNTAAYGRFRKAFGPVNYDVTIANFSFVVW